MRLRRALRNKKAGHGFRTVIFHFHKGEIFMSKITPMTVKDYMTANVITFKPDTDIMDAIRTLLSKRISGAPVVDKRGNIVGMLSEKDCLEVLLKSSYFEEGGGKVSEFMTPGATTISLNANLVDVARMFLKNPYKRYPVMRDNVLVGQISRADVLKALKDMW
jgi:CBS domain-containing protein